MFKNNNINSENKSLSNCNDFFSEDEILNSTLFQFKSNSNFQEQEQNNLLVQCNSILTPKIIDIFQRLYDFIFIVFD